MDRFAPNGAGANALRARVATLVGARSAKSKARPALVPILEYGLVGAIGVVFGIVFWLGLGPLPEPPVVAPAAPAPKLQLAAAGSANAFRNGAAPAPVTEDQLVNGPDLTETTLNLTLHGTWVDASGGTAIIKTPDDKQGRYQRGATIWENATLERVFRDQVVINRDGVLESLRLVGRQSPANPQAAELPAVNPATEGEVLTTLGAFISITPETTGDGDVHLVLEPGEDIATFLASGLKPGDILVGVDGEPFGGDIGASIEYLQQVTDRETITVNVDRGGVVMPIEINLQGLTANGG